MIASWALQPGLGPSRLSSQASCAVWIPIFISSVSTRYENAWWWTVVKLTFSFFWKKKHKTQKQLLLVWTWRSIRSALSPSVSNTFVTLSQWRRRVRLNNAFPSSPSPRMLPRRATLNVLTLNMHVDETSVELQWLHPVPRVCKTCISMWFHHCKCSFYWLYQY